MDCKDGSDEVVCGMHLIAHSYVHVFNMIPTEMQDSSSLLFFKSKCKDVDFDFQVHLFYFIFFYFFIN